MMKNIISLTVLLAISAVVLTGCKNEEDDLFSSSAAERLAEAKIIYTQRFGSTTWVMEYYPLTNTELDPETRDPYPAGLGYLILNRFKADGSVEQGMNNSVSDNKYLSDTSLWEVITDQGPVLSFNTYNNCIHAFSNPGVANSDLNLYQGRGYEGDYEFGILNLEEGAERVMLRGKKRNTLILMHKLPYDTDFETYLSDIIAFKEKLFPASAPNNPLLSLGDTTFVLTKASKGLAEIYPVGGDAVTENSWHPYLITKRGDKYYMRFRDKIGRGNCDAQEFVYNPESDQFTCVENAAYVIHGPAAADFFNEAISASHKWMLARTNEMSDQMKAVYEKMYEDFRKVGSGNYTLQNVQFSKINDASDDNGKLKVDVAYRNKNATAHMFVYFDVVFTDHSLIISNRQVQGAGQNIINAVSGLDEFLKTIETELTVAPGASAFNISTVKLTSSSDINYSFILNFIN